MMRILYHHDNAFLGEYLKVPKYTGYPRRNDHILKNVVLKICKATRM
jgi:hypothetical protein